MNRALKHYAWIIIVASCLLITGCSGTPNTETFKKWQDLINLLPEEKSNVPENVKAPEENIILGESIDIDLYFVAEDKASLETEKRTIVKTEGIARKTIEELIKGPDNVNYSNPMPAGTKLLDINIKPDGLCIVDLSSQARLVNNSTEEQLMVYAIANTVGQFPSVSEVTFMVDGEKVDQLGGFLDLSMPIEPDYSF